MGRWCRAEIGTSRVFKRAHILAGSDSHYCNLNRLRFIYYRNLELGLPAKWYRLERSFERKSIS